MPNDKTYQVLKDGQLAVATTPIEGTIISQRGEKTVTALVSTSGGNQLAVKTYSLGSGGGKPEYVSVLPETGEEGILYMVNSGTTRDGYAIFQMFAWHENEWIAIGAFDVGISPTGLVYEQSFDATTGTWTVTVNQ